MSYSDDELRSLDFDLPQDQPTEKNIRHDELDKAEDWLTDHGAENYLEYFHARRKELDES